MTDEQIQRRKEGTLKVLIWAVGVYTTVTLMVLGYCCSQIIGINIRVATIEANRFTSKDALKLNDTLFEIQKQLASFPKKVPPDWFILRVEKIDRRLEKVEGKCNLL